MKVVVTGAAGQVGQDVQAVLRGLVPAGGSTTALLGATPVKPGEFDVIAFDRAGLDVTDETRVHQVIGEIQPDVVVNLAAYTAVDKAESDPQGARHLNVDATRFLNDAANHVGAHFVFVSTDYVFPGDRDRPLVESDPTDPLSVYGATKLAGEQACSPSASIVRTSWVAGVHGKNLFHLAAAVARDGRSLKFVNDQVGTPTAAADLAAGLIAVVRERPSGILHIAGTGQASWFDAIQYAVEVGGGSPDQVSPITTAQLDPQPAATRPGFSPLASERLSAVGLIPLPDWHEGIERLVAAIGHQLDAAPGSPS